MIKKKKLYDLVNFEISWSIRRLKDKYVRDYDYQGMYDGHYHDSDYYERLGNYDKAQDSLKDFIF